MEQYNSAFEPDIDDMREKKDVNGLIKALKNDDLLIRKNASIALKKVGDERAVEPLIKSLRYEKWQDEYIILSTVRENSAEAIGIIGDKRAVEPLINALFEDVDENVRWKAAYALGSISDKSAVKPLIEALNDARWVVRGHVANALGNIGDKSAVEPLISALNDEDWHVRKYAAVALGNMGDERAISYLVKALEDEDEDVRSRSIVALGNMGDTAIEPLINAFEDGNWCVKGKIAEIFGNTNDERSVGLLINALNGKNKKGTNKYVRGKAAEALGKIGDQRAVEPLIKALDEKYIYVRLKAEDALERIRSAGKVFWIMHYDDGEISFDYPTSWEVVEHMDEKKIIKGSCANSALTFSINRLEDVSDVSQEEFSEILKNVFLIQNSKILSSTTFKANGMDAYLLLGENPHVSMTKIMIIAFKKHDLLYYLWFSGEPGIFNTLNGDIDLIVESFRIHR
ncbi:HEAT repeat domain-containing protein [Methanobacterium paludis]|uniref:PBS lyase HEAT domain protein repeat-containing protein n=1 Tax=Methanobacterium paludis (strain DSM 25820 / JCM 18151 / SWAN1) TaxID=868131 RepID=F6D6B4_METPW|nr:HEAT repeat domain-containing protein [Methanobacterium paludis]AEG18935.1 PBS lyase HEAT domain protein repeat-containing protein [Methanobacterium paludis]